jgi:hypothetical protein
MGLFSKLKNKSIGKKLLSKAASKSPGAKIAGKTMGGKLVQKALGVGKKKTPGAVSQPAVSGASASGAPGNVGGISGGKPAQGVQTKPMRVGGPGQVDAATRNLNHLAMGRRRGAAPRGGRGRPTP